MNSLEMIDHNIKLLTLNINGLNNPMKHQEVMTKLKKGKSQIFFFFLQETHLSNLESGNLRSLDMLMHFTVHIIMDVEISVKFKCIKKNL